MVEKSGAERFSAAEVIKYSRNIANLFERFRFNSEEESINKMNRVTVVPFDCPRSATDARRARSDSRRGARSLDSLQTAALARAAACETTDRQMTMR